jgi:hypothetical protein
MSNACASLFQRFLNSVDTQFDCTDTLHQRVNRVQPAQFALVDHRKLTAQLFDLGSQLFQIIHFLRRSFASLGESRAVLGTRPATTLAPENPHRNLHMETAMSGTSRLIPERAEVISAYRMVTHPEEFRDVPDIDEKMRRAWKVLLADRRMRIEAKRAAAAIRALPPKDAA